MADADEPIRKFELITGDWVQSSDWLNFPAELRARAPEERGQFCKVRVSKTDVIKAAGARRRQPAFDFWSMLAGKAPPLPHQEAEPDSELTRLSDAVACFQGIRRPIAEDGEGAGYLIYILNPRWFYVYDLRPPVVICRKERVPDDLVFAAYVRLDEPSNGVNRGVLTHWQFVEAHHVKRQLPMDFGDRYERRWW